MLLLVHLLKIETDLKAARLHFRLQIRICVLYRFFSTDAGTQPNTNRVCKKSSDSFFRVTIAAGRSGADLPRHALLRPSGALTS